MVAGRSGGHASKLALSRPFKGFRLPKRRSKLQKSKIELKVTKNGFRLEAFDWENPLKNACALVFSGRRLTQRHGGFREFARSFPGTFQKLPEAAKLPKSGSKRLPARIWPKTGRFPIVPEGGFNCGPEAAKLPKFGSKRLPARINCQNLAWLGQDLLKLAVLALSPGRQPCSSGWHQKGRFPKTQV